MKPKRDLPILLGIPTSADTVKAWCSWCARWHHHGFEPAEKRPTHRAAHCLDEDGPFKSGGYMIRVVPLNSLLKDRPRGHSPRRK